MKLKKDLFDILKNRKITFSWNSKEVTGVDLGIITHRSNIDSLVKLVQQKKRKFALKR